MKKVLYSFWSLLMVASMVLTTSCGKEEEDVTPAAPSISFTGVTDPSGTTVNVGQAVNFTVDIAAPGGFNNVVVKKTVGNGSTTDFDSESKAAGQTVTSFTYPFSYTPISADAGQNVTFDFVVEDDNGKKSTKTFVVSVNEPALLNYTAVLLGGKDNATVGSFYNAKDNSVYLQTAAQNNKDKVDFLYYYGANNLATISAPTTEDAKTVFGATVLQGMNNATNFVRTTADFAAVTTSSQITNAWQNQKSGAVANDVKSLQVGDTFVFELAASRGYRLGIAKVSNIQGTTGSRTITLDIKLQSTDN